MVALFYCLVVKPGTFDKSGDRVIGRSGKRNRKIQHPNQETFERSETFETRKKGGNGGFDFVFKPRA
jgi:hypothetical protein